MSKNRKSSYLQQNSTDNFYSAFDGKKLIFNYDINLRSGLDEANDSGIEVIRSEALKNDPNGKAKFLWRENALEAISSSKENLSFNEFSSWYSSNKVTLDFLRINEENNISGNYSPDSDSFVIGTNIKNIGMDGYTIQSRSTEPTTNDFLTDLNSSSVENRSNINSALFLNPYEGNIYLGDLWTPDLENNNVFELKAQAKNINISGNDTNITAQSNLNLSGDVISINATTELTINGSNPASIARGDENSFPISPKNNDLYIEVTDDSKTLYYYDSTLERWVDLFDSGIITG